MVRFILKLTIATLFLSTSFVTFAADNAEFVFNVRVLKNTCNVSVSMAGKETATIDFGTITLNKLKSDSAKGGIFKAFDIKLTECKNNTFTGSYVTISGNEANNGFLDSPAGKNFAVRVTDKANAKQADNVFYSNTTNKVWTGISSDNQSKTLYSYVMCKNGIADCSTNAANLGPFKATVTLTFLID